jgi:hypothetical protein
MNGLKPLRRLLAATLREKLIGPLALLLAAALSACGGGSGASSLASNDSSSCGATACGAAVVTLTDAPGDFLSYTVKIVSLKLKRDDGTEVETLPVATTVDFAKLVDLTEIVSASQIPAGKYVSGTVTLDYTGATIMVDDGTTSGGVAVKPVDGAGADVTTLDMQVQLDGGKPLLITSKSAGHIAFDFDLKASNSLDSTTAPTTVTVTPVLTASIVPPDHKELRVRGPLESTDQANHQYKVKVKPFYASDSGSRGELTVTVNSATSYEIDGVAYTGDAGLTQLATLQSGTLTAAFGTLTLADHVFTATRVLAGTSVENSHQDGIDGVVVARSGTQLTVRGVTLERRDGDCGYNRHQVLVNVDADTGVTKEGTTDAGAIGDISVGQRIHAFGTLDFTDSAHPTLDATGAVGGRVRLEITDLWGLVNSATSGSGGGPGSVNVNLKSIEGLRMTNRDGSSAFDFAGTGAPQDPPVDPNPNDADPANYLIDTGILTLPDSYLVPGNPARFLGFVAPFGTAAPTGTPPVADFSAVTLVDYAATNAWLKISWPDPGLSTPFATLAATGLTLGDLSTSTRHSIGVGPLRIDLTTLATPLQIEGDTGSTALFAIAHEATRQSDTFASFGDFVDALTTALSSNTVEHVVAEGTYDNSTGMFTATHMAVVLEN